MQPQAGRLCIFFTRTDDGAVDPHSWHGGERLRAAPPSAGSAGGAATEKHILTLFKEADASAWDEAGGASLEPYLAPQIAEQHRYLDDLAQTHRPFFE